MTEKRIAEEKAGGPAATLAAFRAVETATSAPPGPKLSWLGEALVHSADIRRPLGIPHTPPLDAVTKVTEFYAGSNVLIGGKRRVAGLTLKATDTDWSHGDGPLVEGPAVSLMLATTGPPGRPRRPARSRCGDPPLALIQPGPAQPARPAADPPPLCRDRNVHEDDGDGGTARPTGRVPQWVLDESATPTARRAAPPAPPVPLGRAPDAPGLVLVVALGVGTGALTGPGPWPVRRSSGTPCSSTRRSAADRPRPRRRSRRPAGCPTVRPPVSRPPRAAGLPLPPPPEGGTHAFVSFQADGVTPVAYDPCRPVHYVIRPDGAPPAARRRCARPFARIAEVTGLQFVYDGATDEAPTLDRQIFQPDRYGRRWAPVLSPGRPRSRTPRSPATSSARPAACPSSLGDGPRVFVTGTVSLDAPRLRRSSAGAATETARVDRPARAGPPGRPGARGRRQQLMFPEARRDVPDFAAGT